jgi:site-specific DNA-cytosine methylase
MIRIAFDKLHGEEGPRHASGKRIGRPGIGVRKLFMDKPAYPMFEKCFHPTEARHISVAEVRRLCQLPDEFQFHTTSEATQMLLMQRAVMPGVGAWLARGAHRAIRRNREVDPSLQLIYDLRKPNQEIRTL